MSFALLLSKSVLVPAGGAVAVGASAGGAYYVYSTRSAANSSTRNQASTEVSTNSFLARVTSTGTDETTLTTALKCTISTQTEVGCKVFKFNTARQNNAITKIEKSALTEISTPKTDLVDHNYVVVELEGGAQTFETLKNKSITLKHNTTELTKLNFDQLLVKATESDKEIYKPIDAVTDTYIVSTTSDVATESPASSGISGFRCKYAAGSVTNVVDNYDDSCQLIAIAPTATENKITSLTEVTSASTAATTLSASTFYKLTLNSKQLYNLDWTAAQPPLSIVITEASEKKSTTLTIHQKLTNNTFVGKTNLALAQVTTTKTDANTKVTASKCNFSKSVVTTDQFDCNLHKTTKGSEATTDLHKLTITEGAVATGEAFAANEYFLIKFGTPQDISNLTKDKQIYYQITKTGSDEASKHELVELKIIDLLSGDFASSKKPLFITNYSPAAAAA